MKSIITEGKSGASTEAVKSSGITRDDWLKALGETNIGGEDAPDAVTVAEFAEMFGISCNPARLRLKRLERLGKAIKLKKRNMRTDGRAQVVTAWRLVKKEGGHARTGDAGRDRAAHGRRARR